MIQPSDDLTMRSSRINCSLTTEFSLIQENILIQNERITQLFVIQSEQNPFVWFGVLFVDRGIYIGAVIRFNMIIDSTYPDSPCPKIVFDPIPYHPLINPTTGELDTKNAFPNWNSNNNKLYEILLFVKRIIRQADEYILQIRDLIVSSIIRDEHSQEDEQNESQSDQLVKQNSEILPGERQNRTPSIQNVTRHMLDSDIIELFSSFHHTLEFIKVYQNDPNLFNQRVEEFKQVSCQNLFDRPPLCGDDENALIFTPWDKETFEPVRNCILAGRFTPTSLFASYHKETESVSFIPGHEAS